jgi:hypothetical protein
MRSLWELDISTAMSAFWVWHSPQLQKGASSAMSNNLQAGMGTAPSCRRGQGQNAAQLLFIRCLPLERSNCRFFLFWITTMSHCLRIVALLPCLLLYIINSLEVVEAVSVSIKVPSPPDPSFLHVCLLSFLNLPSLPVKFLG